MARGILVHVVGPLSKIFFVFIAVYRGRLCGTFVATATRVRHRFLKAKSASGLKPFLSLPMELVRPLMVTGAKSLPLDLVPLEAAETKTRLAMPKCFQSLGLSTQTGASASGNLSATSRLATRVLEIGVVRDFGCQWICGETKLSCAIRPRFVRVLVHGTCFGGDAAHRAVVNESDQRGRTQNGEYGC